MTNDTPFKRRLDAHPPLLRLTEGAQIQFGAYGIFEVQALINSGARALVYGAKSIKQEAKMSIEQEAQIGKSENSLSNRFSVCWDGTPYDAVLKLPYLTNEAAWDAEQYRNWCKQLGESYDKEVRHWNQLADQRSTHEKEDPVSQYFLDRGFILTLDCSRLSPTAVGTNRKSVFSIENANNVDIVADIQSVPIGLQPYIGNCSPLEKVLRDLKYDDPADHENLWRMMEECAKSLSSVHRHGLVHGDIHSGNVLVLGNSANLLNDFQKVVYVDLEHHVQRTMSSREDLKYGNIAEYVDAEELKTYWPKSPPIKLVSQSSEKDGGVVAPGDSEKSTVSELSEVQKVQRETLAEALPDVIAVFESETTDREPFPNREEIADIWSDIYMLGRMFLWMPLDANKVPRQALEWKKRITLGRESNFEVPDKPQIKDILKTKVPNFYKYNIGVADVVARCVWQPAHSGRYTRVAQVVRDIQLFRDCRKAVRRSSESISQLQDDFAKLGQWKLIQSVVDYRSDAILSEVADWNGCRVIEFYGGHHEVVNLWAYIFGSLQPGDSYVTVTPTRFWDRQSNGIDGRLLNAQVVATMIGVHIYRIRLEDVPGHSTDTVSPSDVAKVQDEYIELLRSAGVRVEGNIADTGFPPERTKEGPGAFLTRSVKYEDAKELIMSRLFFGFGDEGDWYDQERKRVSSRVFRSILTVHEEGLNGIEIPRYYGIRGRSVAGEGGVGNRLIGFRMNEIQDRDAQRFFGQFRKIFNSSK